MKFPICPGNSDSGRFLEFDCDRELVFLVGPDGDRLHALTWGAVAELIAATGRTRSGADGRRVPRAPLALRITYRTPDGKQQVTVTRDVGAGGVFIETARPLPRGTEVEVAFALPDPPFDRIVAKGRVAWSQVGSDRHLFLPGMGLQFTEIAAESKRSIAELVTQLTEARHAA